MINKIKRFYKIYKINKQTDTPFIIHLHNFLNVFFDILLLVPEEDN